MKTAIYIEDGVVQLVITPESDFEKDALKSFQKEPFTAEIFSGSFYDCRGGWVRQASYYPQRSIYGSLDDNDRDKSLILRATTKAKEPVSP
jgi:hypothetical protein